MIDRLNSALADRYTIERELGAGGMATVYLAHDIKHDRKVAIKVLRPELAAVLGAERFVQEIKTTANLQHPHILPLFDSGEADSFLYYVMPYIEGETLRGKLNRETQLGIEEAVKIVTDVADALDYAHRHNVIHRDIKPENILLHDGAAIVADFGIALAVDAAGGERMTETGLSLGTPAYMSPEQVGGDRELDLRSDIYSLACVLYEMLAGDPPFVASSTRAVMARHVTDTPPPITTVRPSVPSGIATSLEQALSKAPVDRFESASAFAAAMSERGGDAPARVMSIVVLPFTNMSPDPDNEYFADGLTEEIITDLSQLTALRVISRNSAMLLKGTDKDTRTIGRELDCQYVLEGGVRKAGKNLRITAQLIDAESDTHMWAEKYTGVMDDVFEIQESVSRAIADALALELSPEEKQKLEERPIENVQAYECYLRARHEFWRMSPDALDRAVRHLKNGLALVGDNALLYAGLGTTYLMYHNAGIRFDRSLLRDADECAEKCFALTPDSAKGHLVRAWLAWFDPERDDDPSRHLKEGLRLDPNDPDILLTLVTLYGYHGWVDAARPLMRHAMEIDPLTAVTWFCAGLLDWMEGRFEDALEPIRKGHETDPQNVVAAWFYILTLRFVGRLDECNALVATLREQETSPLVAWLASLFSAAWKDDKSQVLELCKDELATVARRLGIWALWVADCHALVGANDEALDWLETATNRRFTNYPFLSEYDPFLAGLRGDARFSQLMERVKHQWQKFDA